MGPSRSPGPGPPGPWAPKALKLLALATAAPNNMAQYIWAPQPPPNSPLSGPALVGSGSRQELPAQAWQVLNPFEALGLSGGFWVRSQRRLEMLYEAVYEARPSINVVGALLGPKTIWGGATGL